MHEDGGGRSLRNVDKRGNEGREKCGEVEGRPKGRQEMGKGGGERVGGGRGKGRTETGRVPTAGEGGREGGGEVGGVGGVGGRGRRATCLSVRRRRRKLDERKQRGRELVFLRYKLVTSSRSALIPRERVGSTIVQEAQKPEYI